MINKATLPVNALKIVLPLRGNVIPRLVSPEGPLDEPVINVVLGGGALTARARLNAKNYRKMLKAIDDNGPDNVVIVLQGELRPPEAPGEPFVIFGAGFQVNVRTRVEQPEPAHT